MEIVGKPKCNEKFSSFTSSLVPLLLWGIEERKDSKKDLIYYCLEMRMLFCLLSGEFLNLVAVLHQGWVVETRTRSIGSLVLLCLFVVLAADGDVFIFR